MRFQLIKEHQLEKLQGKVEYLENQIFMLGLQRTESMNKIQNLNRMKDELQSSMAQRRGEIDYMNQGTGWYDNTIQYCCDIRGFYKADESIYSPDVFRIVIITSV